MKMFWRWLLLVTVLNRKVPKNKPCFGLLSWQCHAFSQTQTMDIPYSITSSMAMTRVLDMIPYSWPSIMTVPCSWSVIITCFYHFLYCCSSWYDYTIFLTYIITMSCWYMWTMVVELCFLYHDNTLSFSSIMTIPCFIVLAEWWYHIFFSYVTMIIPSFWLVLWQYHVFWSCYHGKTVFDLYSGNTMFF